MAKGEVCKTFIRRFESGRHLLFAEVAELADARDLKSLGDTSPYRFESGLRYKDNSIKNSIDSPKIGITFLQVNSMG